MNRLKQVLTFAIIFFVLPFGTLAILWKDSCHETRTGEHRADMEGLVAAEISTDCGSAMKVATEVRLEKREASGELAAETVLVLAGKTTIPVHWSDGPTLTIDLPDHAEVVKHKTEWQGVKVAFTNIPVRSEAP